MESEREALLLLRMLLVALRSVADSVVVAAASSLKGGSTSSTVKWTASKLRTTGEAGTTPPWSSQPAVVGCSISCVAAAAADGEVSGDDVAEVTELVSDDEDTLDDDGAVSPPSCASCAGVDFIDATSSAPPPFTRRGRRQSEAVALQLTDPLPRAEERSLAGAGGAVSAATVDTCVNGEAVCRCVSVAGLLLEHACTLHTGGLDDDEQRSISDEEDDPARLPARGARGFALVSSFVLGDGLVWRGLREHTLERVVVVWYARGRVD